MKIIDYNVLWKPFLTDLELEVKTLIPDGWQPLGGVVIDIKTGEKYSTGYMQTMVKYEN